MDVTKLTERGFVAMIANKPYWIAVDQIGKPWLYQRNQGEAKWIQIRQLTVADVATYSLYRVSEATAQAYHDGNKSNRLYGQPIPKEEEKVPISEIPDIDRFRQAIINSINNCVTLDDLKKRLTNFVEQLSNY